MTFAVRKQNCLCPLARNGGILKQGAEAGASFQRRCVFHVATCQGIFQVQWVVCPQTPCAPDCLLPFFVLFLR